MARIAWIEDAQATGALAEMYAAMRQMNPFGDGKVPDVFRGLDEVSP